jgi:hypothetical protein
VIEQLSPEPASGAFTPRRILRLGVLVALVAGFLAYVTRAVPVVDAARQPVLTRDQVMLHWSVALRGLLIVLAGDLVVLSAVWRRARRERAQAVPEEEVARAEPASGWPRVLRFQRVPVPVLAAAGLASAGALLLGFIEHVPLWEKALWALAPLAPVALWEGRWKYRHYGVFAVFLGIAVLQVGHLLEHTSQVSELLVNHGDLTKSHGIFGQLDFETVHFFWDTGVWTGSGILLYLFRRNPWLWISWTAASLHEVEHMYLFWVEKVHFAFWAHGGLFGIMGNGGLIGSPLSRPYLHFAYNFVVVVPMLIALFDQARSVRDRRPDEASDRSRRGEPSVFVPSAGRDELQRATV